MKKSSTKIHTSPHGSYSSISACKKDAKEEIVENLNKLASLLPCNTLTISGVPCNCPTFSNIPPATVLALRSEINGLIKAVEEMPAK